MAAEVLRDWQGLQVMRKISPFLPLGRGGAVLRGAIKIARIYERGYSDPALDSDSSPQELSQLACDVSALKYFGLPFRPVNTT